MNAMMYLFIKNNIWFILVPLLVMGTGCGQNNANPHASHGETATQVYTCPMHPQIIRNSPGSCPICGMDLVKKETGKPVADASLEALLQPTNEYVISTVLVTTIAQKELPLEIEALGTITYDTRQSGTISSRIEGRIERLYVRYRFQKVSKGQRIMDIYSPELVNAQQNLLFLLKNDPDNASMIDAARQRLLLLGMTQSQVQQVINSGKPALSVAVFSNYSGHIHEAINPEPMPETTISTDNSMNAPDFSTTQELSLKEGMYVQKGQSIFAVYNPSRVWALLNIYGDNVSLIRVGNSVSITPETAPSKNFRAMINFIEPFYRPESKTLTARVYFNNGSMHLPVGSQVRAIIFANNLLANWLPKEAVLSLGMEKVVFRKEGNVFRVHKVETGLQQDNLIQVTEGLSPTDSVAANAQFLMDNESFIKVDKP
jgi:membrane fusion protein, copper/silver efflux system